MSIKFIESTAYANDHMRMINSINGDALYFSVDDIAQCDSIALLHAILSQPIIVPRYRITVLRQDETVDYLIPEADIIESGIQYNENYQNGERRNISLKLINRKQYEEQNIYSEDGLVRLEKIEKYPYIPNINNLWYGKKIKLDLGIEYNGKIYYFSRGIYYITGFKWTHSSTARDISYNLKDKFSIFTGETGTLETGYEIPVGTPIEEVLSNILNLQGTDGEPYDPQDCIVDSKYSGFVTQATIRVDDGGKMSEIIDQLATQMSAEYFYNSNGNLCFYPIDDSMNILDKPIIWSYDEPNMSGVELEGQDEIINVTKVTGTNVDNRIYSATAKNTNLSSPINIYYVKERRGSIQSNSNVWSDEMAQQLADYNLWKASIGLMKQNIEIPYNPALMVNNYVEITNLATNIKMKRFIINSISHTAGAANMTLQIANIDNLPSIGGLQKI